MTKEMTYIKTLFSTMGRNKKIEIIGNSNLTDREIQLLELRLIKGTSLKDCAVIFNIEEDSVNKFQLKTIKKLVKYLQNIS